MIVNCNSTNGNGNKLVYPKETLVVQEIVYFNSDY